MTRSRCAAAGLLAAILCSAAIKASAAEPAAPPDPLRLVPPAADFVVKVERPRAIADMVIMLTGKPELEGFRGYRDYIGSTNYQLFRQLVAHFEHELGHSWPELLDQVAGGGIVLAVKLQPKQPGPVVVILQGTDPKLTDKFFRNLREVVADEQSRQGVIDEYKSESYRGVETFHIGENLYAAALDAALVYSSKPEALHAAIDQHLDPAKPSLLEDKSLADARRLAPTDSLVWAWVNLGYTHDSKDFKNLSELPTNFFPPFVTAGGLIDVLRRSPWVIAAIHPDGLGLALSVRMPRGTNGMHDIVKAHVPPPGQPGALPLLAPEGTLFTTSFYLDLAEFWKQRAVLLPADQLKQFEAGDKRSESILQGTRFSQFLEYAGARHRVVVARQENTGYSFQGDSHYPAFGWVFEMRAPESFEKAIDKPLNGAAFLAGLQFPILPIDETYKGVKIYGYRFVENDANKERSDGSLFNFSPCRARVGNQYIVSSTLDLTHRLIEALQKETTAVPPSSSGVTTLQSRVAWSGVSNYLGGIKKQLVTQNVLQQGNTPEAAAKEISLFLSLIDQLGKIESSIRMEPEQYQFDLRIVP